MRKDGSHIVRKIRNWYLYITDFPVYLRFINALQLGKPLGRFFEWAHSTPAGARKEMREFVLRDLYQLHQSNEEWAFQKKLFKLCGEKPPSRPSRPWRFL
jgi:hypothetical protein